MADSLAFAKYQALGNDFLIVDARGNPAVVDDSDLAIALLDRHFGAGADDLIFVLPSSIADVRMRIRTPSGGRLSFCGNGIRCLARFLLTSEICKTNPIRIETDVGIRETHLLEDGSIEADLLIPDMRAASIPTGLAASDEPVLDCPLELGVSGAVRVSCVNVGNPHAVFFVDDLAATPLQTLGPAIERHPAFPEGVNVHAVQILSADSIQIRTWERGAGLSLA
jgi:diaminopimelate epimerase